MERLTVDNPRNNRETLLNYAYANAGRVYLSYADGERGVDLCEYIAKNACCQEVDAASVMDGACMECDNKTAILYTVAVQAAELRERLAYYEDMEEQGRLVVLPCKVGGKLYRDTFICNAPIDGTRCDEYDGCEDCPYGEKEIVSWECPSAVYILSNIDNFGKKFFLTREEAEQALKEGAK